MKQPYHCFWIFFILMLSPWLIESFGTDDLKMSYAQFKQKYSKPKFTPDQQSRRELIFYSNLEKLSKMIETGCDFCGVTPFYDQTSQQFRGRMGLLPVQNAQFNTNKYTVVQNEAIPEPVKISGSDSILNNNDLIRVSADVASSKNWADDGKVTSIKDQGTCGTCWSFATAAAIQSSMILKGQARNFLFFNEPDLAQQFLLTCAKTGTCKGGYLQQAIDLAYQKGIAYESDVPYLAQKGNQAICSNTKSNYKFTSSDTARFSYYDIGDTQIINLLQQGPLMIAVSADKWQNYGGGILKCASNAQVNHAVLLVGYDSNKWIIKNQWGKDWGQKGYIYVSRVRTQNCKVGTAVHKLWQNSSKLPLFLALVIIILIAF